MDIVGVAELARVEAALDERGGNRIVPGLERITELLALLGDPQLAQPAIHVGGTNGKTSTARMADALLRAHGLRTGRYTSPHLESVTERISIEGEPLTPAAFADRYAEVAPYADLVDAHNTEAVTYFELLTAMAFATFADTPVDVAVVEVGLGGSWDCTNVLNAPVAVLTPVDLDHTKLLGSTVGEIAADKAGIIHPGALLVTAQQQPGAAEAVLRRVAEVGATVAREGVEFGVMSRTGAVGGQLVSLRGLHGEYPDLLLPLYGAHQAHNAVCALAAVEGLLGRDLDLDVTHEAFAAVTSPGRLEVVRRGPTVLLDAAHNPAGLAATAAGVEDAFAFTRLVVVLGVLADKDVVGMLEVLEPLADVVVCTQPSSPRSLPADELGRLATAVFGPDRVEVEPGLPTALDRALALADEDPHVTGVLVTGSIVTVGAARSLLRGRG